jgi:hypothetical protein
MSSGSRAPLNRTCMISKPSMSAIGTFQTNAHQGRGPLSDSVRTLNGRLVLKSRWAGESILGGCRPPQPISDDLP